MLSNSLAAALSRRGVHYGWIVIATTFFSSLVMAGAVGLPGAFIIPLSKEFGWDTAQISSAMAVRLALFGLMGPFSAALAGCAPSSPAPTNATDVPAVVNILFTDWPPF